jgi:hypothetical protein
MQINRRAVGLLCALACAAVPLAMPASATAKAELTVSPTIVRLKADAGDHLTEQISVTAGDDEAIRVELVHADFGFQDSSYQVTLIRDDASDTTAFSTRQWFSLPKRQYLVPKGRTVNLPLSIKVPKNTPAGTYLGAALIRVVPADAAPGASQVQAVPETGPLMFISVAGGEPPKPSVRRFDVPGWVKHGPIHPSIVVENAGDEFFTYEGTIELKGPGKDSKVDVTQQFVVPGQPRRLATSADEKGRSGHPTLGRKDLGFGRYEVVTRLRIEPTGKTLVSRRTVWVIPTWVWTIGIIIALVLAASIAFLVRWFMERRRLAPFLAEEQGRLAREQGVATPERRASSTVDVEEHDHDVASFEEDEDDVDEVAFDDEDDELDLDDEHSLEDSLDEFDDDEDDDSFVR